MVKKKESYLQKIVNGFYRLYEDNFNGTLENISESVERASSVYGNGDLGDKVMGFLGIGSLVIAFYFLAPNFTGNVIGNIEVGSTNLFGMGLFLFGLFNIFVCLRNGKR